MRNLIKLAYLIKRAGDKNLDLADFAQVTKQTASAGLETAKHVAEIVPAAAEKLRLAKERLGIGQGSAPDDKDKRNLVANALRTATYTPLAIGTGIAAHAGAKALGEIPNTLAARASTAVTDRAKHVGRRVIYEPLLGLSSVDDAANAAKSFGNDPLRAKLDNPTHVSRRQALKMFAHDSLLLNDDVQQAAGLTLENAHTFNPSTYLGQKALSANRVLDQLEASASKDKSRLDIDKLKGENFRALAGSRDALMRLNRVLSGLGGGKLSFSDVAKAKLADKIRTEGIRSDAQILDIIGQALPHSIGAPLAALRQSGREKALRADPAEWNRLARMTDNEIASEVHSDVATRVSRFTHMLRKQLQEYLLSAKLHTAPVEGAPMGPRPQVIATR